MSAGIHSPGPRTENGSASEASQWLDSLRDRAAHYIERDFSLTDIGDLGLLSALAPKDVGGLGRSYLETVRAFEAVAEVAGDSGLWFSASAHLWACLEPLRAFGSPIQIERYLPEMLTGSATAANAISEPDAGSDALSVATRGVRRGVGGWSISGTKTFVTNAPSAALFLVLARTGDKGRLDGLSTFLVESSGSQLEVSPKLAKDALPGSEMSMVHLNGHDVDDSAILGGIGGGYAVLMHAMRLERAFIMAPALGLMSRALSEALRYAMNRRQFGRPIAQFDTVRNRLVDMRIHLESAREMIYAAARLADAGLLDHPRASMTKLFVSRAFNQFASELVEIYGAYSLLPDSGATGLLKDALASRFYSGTEDINKKVVATTLGIR